MTSCSAGVTAAAGAALAKETFDYNRENFLYDRKMRQKTEYQIMEFRIKKADLYREDISDIVKLTSVKMDTYLIVNAVQLGFVVMAFCEGRLAPGTPAWLVGAHTLCMAAAFTFYLMSVYFAVHAMVVSKSFEVRMLTQWVRLPVPSWAQIEGARTYGSSFEKVEPRQMFRIPFAMGWQEQVLERANKSAERSGMQEFEQSVSTQDYADEAKSRAVVKDELEDVPLSNNRGFDYKDTTCDPWGLEGTGDCLYELDATLQTDVRKLRHIQLVREAMQYWLSYDGFARCAMGIGTTQLVKGLSYYVLGYVLASNHAIVASWLAVIQFMGIAWVLIRIDMSLTHSQYALGVVLAVAGPLITCWCAKSWAQSINDRWIPFLMPLVYIIESLYFVWLLFASKVVTQKNGCKLPTGFRSVLFLDVFGWIQRHVRGSSEKNLSDCFSDKGTLKADKHRAGAGPAVQAIRYDKQGRPVPIRPEQLPGASRHQQMSDLDAADFATTTFMPHEHDEVLDSTPCNDEAEPDSGGRPWKIFGGLTTLLAILWFLSAIWIGAELWGFTEADVMPFLAEPSKKLDASRMHQMLGLPQSGQALSTSWPDKKLHPNGLACSDDSNTMLVSSQFGLYSAEITAEQEHASFKSLRACDHIRGTALKDTSIFCKTATAGSSVCAIGALHAHGRGLATCPIGMLQQNATHAAGADSHIAEVDDAAAIAMSSSCSGKARKCAYVRTNNDGIVEMFQDSDGHREWFPHRVLKEASTRHSSRVPSGSIAVIQGTHLGVLQADGRHIDFLPLQSNDDRGISSWQLPDPPTDHTWGAMCATGSNLYVLSTGSSASLWRFAVPTQLSKDEKVAGKGSDLTQHLSHQSTAGKLRRRHLWK